MKKGQRKAFEVNLTVSRAVITDSAEAAMAEDRWYRSMAMLLKLQDRLEAEEAAAAAGRVAVRSEVNG